MSMIQNEDIKSLSQLLADGGTKNQLPSADKIFIPQYYSQKTLGEAIDQRLLHGSPMLLHQGTVADSKLYIESNIVTTIEGTALVSPPLNSQITDFPASTIDFQTQLTTGGVIDITFPSSTVGQFRRMGLSLLSNGTLKCLFSDEAVSLGALANPGSLFISDAIPVGYINLECTHVSGKFKTAGSASNIIENSVSSIPAIYVFGSGGGGGGGTGDANELLERLKDRLNDSPFSYLTDNIFKIHSDTKIESSTATYSVIESAYSFSAVGENIVSTQCLDDEFLNNSKDATRVELLAFWKSGSVDTSATYQVSRNNLDYQTITMLRLGDSDTYRGIYTFTDEADATLLTYSVSGADSTVVLNSTNNFIGQKFTISDTSVIRKTVSIYLNKLGSPSGNVSLQIIKDSGGSPSSSLSDIKAESFPVSINTLSTGNITVNFSIPTVALPAGDYWIVIKVDSTYISSYSAGVTQLSVAVDSSSPTIPLAKSYNGTVWSSLSSSVVYIILGRILDLRVKITSGTPNVILKGYGLLYDVQYGVFSDNREIEKFYIPASANTNQFIVTRFLPDADLLSVYAVETQKVYKYGSFYIEGNKVVFPTNTFNSPTAITLIFDQTNGSTFDSSDRNASLMAANFLGSIDPQIDRSAAGRGILLRAPNGTLYEITIRNGGTGFDVYEVTP